MKLFVNLGGCCPYCGSKVNVIEGMVFEYNLNKSGYPEYLESEHYKVTCYCKHCCTQLFALPNNNGGYTVYPDNPMDILMKLDSFKAKRISLIGDGILSSTDAEINPFVNVRAYNSYINDDGEDIREYDDSNLIEERIPIDNDDVPF